MAKYESDIKYIAAPAERVYEKLSNLENFRPMLENAQNNPALREKMKEAGQDPADLDRLRDVELTNDSITVPAPMVGQLGMQIIEREPFKTIKFETTQSPIQANLWIQILPSSQAYTPDGSLGAKIKLTLKADLNPMFKMMLGSKFSEGINKFADMLAMMPY